MLRGLADSASGNSVVRPAPVIRPILLEAVSVNQTFPSGPATMSFSEPDEAPGTGNVVIGDCDLSTTKASVTVIAMSAAASADAAMAIRRRSSHQAGGAGTGCSRCSAGSRDRA